METGSNDHNLRAQGQSTHVDGLQLAMDLWKMCSHTGNRTRAAGVKGRNPNH